MSTSMRLLFLAVISFSARHSESLDLISKCVDYIYKNNIGVESYTLYVHENENFDFMKFNFPLINYSVKRQPYKFKNFKKFDGFIIVVNEETMGEVFEYLSKLDTWNSRGRSVVVYEGEIRRLLKTISIYFVYNVVVVDLKTLEILTYFPYSEENVDDVNLDVHHLSNCKDLDTEEQFYPNKLKNYWRNSTVVVSYMPLGPYVICAECGTGIEVEISELLSKHLGFDLVFDEVQYTNWGLKLPNGTYEGAIRALQIKRAGFVIGHFHLRERDHMVDFDYTFSYMEDRLKWALPSAQVFPHWANLLNIFQPTMWVVSFVVLTLVSLMWSLIVEKSFKPFESTSIPFRTLILIPPPNPPPATLPLRILYFFIWIYCFIINTLWNAFLILYLTHETYFAQIETTEELLESGLILGIHPELAELYKASETPTGLEIYNRYFPCDPTFTCLDRVGHSRDMSSITTNRIFKNNLPIRYKDSNGDNTVELMHEDVVIDFTVMFFQKGYPLYERINEMLIRLRGGGFIDRLDRMQDFTNELTHRQLLFKGHKLGFKVLNMKQMSGAFYLLLFGYFIALVCFLGEICIRRKRNNR